MSSMRQQRTFRWALMPILLGSLLVVIYVIPHKAQNLPIRIISPADGSVFAPGNTITVSVAVTPGIFGIVGVVLQDRSFIAPPTKSKPPFDFSVTIPKGLIGLTQLSAFGITVPGTGLDSPPISIDIEPTAALTQLNVSFTQINFDHAGQQISLTVTGMFADGTSAAITKWRKTTYATNDARVATVDDSGLVTAVGPGNTHILVSNSNQTVDIPISVPQTIKGDLNGDGKVDQDDLNIILDALNETATGPFDTRDVNGDGVIDIRDALQLKLLCTSQCAAINIPPDVSQARPSVRTLWPPNHQMVAVSVLGVTDPDGDPVTIRIVNVRQDEPTNGLGDGDACPDGQGLGTSTALVRAERSGTGNGRVYRIFFTATDGRGGNMPGSVNVSVPHDQAHSAVDDGPLFDSTVCHP